MSIFIAHYDFFFLSRAKVPPFDDPVVFVNHVGRFSRVQGLHNPFTGIYTFRGIKYADPPYRENRFLRPKIKRLSGKNQRFSSSLTCKSSNLHIR